MTKIVQITAISDLHNHYFVATDFKEITPFLIVSGDLVTFMSKQEFLPLITELSKLPHPHKIIVPGNHDPDDIPWIRRQCKRLGLHFLVDQRLDLDGVSFYGFPWTYHPDVLPASKESREMLDMFSKGFLPKNWNGRWNFSLKRDDGRMAQKLSFIPKNIDVLISHGPGFGHLDGPSSDVHLGSEALAQRLSEVKPKLMICGHIHVGYGEKIIEWAGGATTQIINAAITGGADTPVRKPFIVEADLSRHPRWWRFISP